MSNSFGSDHYQRRELNGVLGEKVSLPLDTLQTTPVLTVSSLVSKSSLASDR